VERNNEAVEKKSKEMVNPKSLKYQRDKDREMVRGIFKFYEVPGGSMSFNYRAYKEDPVERFDMVDGQIYTVPLGVAKHLNKNCWYPIHAHMTDQNGVPVARVGQRVRRVGFQSLEFVDVDDLTFTPELTTVESIGL
jgi:hypothetical protein